MTTADRVDAEIYRAWNRALTPVEVPAWSHPNVRADEYAGRHRRPSPRRFSLRALFYFGRHRR